VSWLSKALGRVKQAFGTKKAHGTVEECPIKRTGLLVVVLREEDRTPVDQALVMAEGIDCESKHSDKDGMALFKPLPAGEYDIRTELPEAMVKSYVKPAVERQVVPLGECPIKVVHATPLGRLDVKILYEGGKEEVVLGGVKLKIKGPETRSGTTDKTADDGWLPFENVQPGDYEIAVESLGEHAKSYNAPRPSGTHISPGESRGVVLLVHAKGWVKFVVEDTTPAKAEAVTAFKVKATLPGGEVKTARATAAAVKFDGLAAGKVNVESVEIDEGVWEFVATEQVD